MYEIQRMTTRQRDEEQIGTYRELIGIAEEVVESTQMVLARTSKTRGKDLLADIAFEQIRKDIEHYCGLGSHVIDQARRRVLNGEQVPNAEKIYSIFEAHTDLIKRGKIRTPIEFGHKVFLAESAQGLITQYVGADWGMKWLAAGLCAAAARWSQARRHGLGAGTFARLPQRSPSNSPYVRSLRWTGHCCCGAVMPGNDPKPS
jgi:hypothetical protein